MNSTGTLDGWNCIPLCFSEASKLLMNLSVNIMFCCTMPGHGACTKNSHSLYTVSTCALGPALGNHGFLAINQDALCLVNDLVGFTSSK